MKAIIIGISGPSSSGKTSLARLLRQILLDSGHKAFILHEDDFYVTDKDIPIHAVTGYQDWDCLGSIDEKLFQRALEHIKTYGGLPEDLHSKEDQNSVGKVNIDSSIIRELTAEAKQITSSTPIAIVDGFLLYTPALESLYTLIDIRLFLPVTRQLMVARRSARSGYVTLEGFWEDPPGYVEKVVWPNYAKDHAHLFKDGDVESRLDERQAATLDLHVAPGESMEDMTLCLQWAWKLISASLQHKA